MVFGGINGLNIFHPKAFRKNEHVPKVWITNLEINNEELALNQSSGIVTKTIEQTEAIQLPFGKNNITLEFAALEYTAPEKNKFQYYMKGLEQPWVHTTTENKANYLAIPPGNYEFQIKAANGDGIYGTVIKNSKHTDTSSLVSNHYCLYSVCISDFVFIMDFN